MGRPTKTSPSPAADRQSESSAKGTPQSRLDGAETREAGHRKHRRHCRRERRLAQHLIIDRCLAVGQVAAPDLDDLLPPAQSGNRTYIGTAFTDLRRAGIIRTDGGPFATTAGGRHAHLLHRWRLATDARTALQFKVDHPIPDEDRDHVNTD